MRRASADQTGIGFVLDGQMAVEGALSNPHFEYFERKAIGSTIDDACSPGVERNDTRPVPGGIAQAIHLLVVELRRLIAYPYGIRTTEYPLAWYPAMETNPLPT